MGSAAGVLFFRFDQVAIGSILGVSQLGAYAVPANALARVQGLVQNTVAPVYPRVASTVGDVKRTQATYLEASRLVAVIAMPAAVILFILANRILLHWIGGSPGQVIAAESTGAMRWLVGAILIQELAAVPVVFCEASGRPQINKSLRGHQRLPARTPCVLPRAAVRDHRRRHGADDQRGSPNRAFIIITTVRVVRTPLGMLTRVAYLRPMVATAVTAALAWAAVPLVTNRLTLVAALVGLGGLYLAAALALGAVRRDDLVRARALLPGRPGRFSSRRGLSRPKGT